MLKANISEHTSFLTLLWYTGTDDGGGGAAAAAVFLQERGWIPQESARGFITGEVPAHTLSTKKGEILAEIQDMILERRLVSRGAVVGVDRYLRGWGLRMLQGIHMISGIQMSFRWLKFDLGCWGRAGGRGLMRLVSEWRIVLEVDSALKGVC